MTNLALSISQAGALIKAPVKYPDWALASVDAGKREMPDRSTFEAQVRLYTRLSWIYAAVTRTGEAAALQKLNVKRAQGEDSVDVPNHDFEKLFRNPNPLMSQFEFVVGLISFLGINGNSYLFLNRTSETQPPRELWIVPSYRILPVPDDQMYIKGYAYDPGTGVLPLLLPTWQICHHKTFNPMSDFVGMSGLDPLVQSAKTDLAMQKWTGELFGENNARLPGILAFRDLVNDQQWQIIQDDTKRAAKMRNFLMLRGVGDKVDWMQAAASQSDMQYLEQRGFTKEEIWAIFAPGLSSMLAVNATEANSKAGKQTFLDLSVWPKLVAIAQKFTQVIMPAYGDNLTCEFEDPRQVDRALQLQEQEAYSKTHTLEEIRMEYYGDDPLGDDRDLMLPIQISSGTTTIDDSPPEPVPAPLQQFQEQPPEEMPDEEEEEEEENPDVEQEMAKWMKKACYALEQGKPAAVVFESKIIPQAQHTRIDAALKTAKTARQVWAAFSGKIDPLADSLNRACDLLERIGEK